MSALLAPPPIDAIRGKFWEAQVASQLELIEFRLALYDRRPESRTEVWSAQSRRIPLDIAERMDRHEHRLYMMLSEFSATWVGHDGELP